MQPIKKSGHEYSFREESFLYRSPGGREREFFFQSPMKLKFSPYSGRITLKGPEGKAPLSPLSNDEEKALVLEYFQRWKKRDPEAAKKAAFDYIDGQRQFLPIAFVACLLVGLPVATALITDSREQYSCTKQLQEESVVSAMNVTKFRKKRKGHYVLTLNFTTPKGETIEGTDQLIMNNEMKEDEMEAHIPKTVPVVYSPSNPSCWSLTPSTNDTVPNWAKRRYFTWFNAMFGILILAGSLWGLAWSSASWRRRNRPFAEELSTLFKLS